MSMLRRSNRSSRNKSPVPLLVLRCGRSQQCVLKVMCSIDKILMIFYILQLLKSTNFTFPTAAPKLNCTKQNNDLYCQHLTSARVVFREPVSEAQKGW